MANHNLDKPEIVWIAAKDLYIDEKDLKNDLQRNPHDRIRDLKKIFGEHGQLFTLEHCGALKVRRRTKKGWPIADGGGRHLCVIELLKKPNLKLPCVIQEHTPPLDAFVIAQNSIRVPQGKIFMAKGNDPHNDYEHRVCNVVKEAGFTCNPGNGPLTIGVNTAILGMDLEVLRAVLRLVSEHWVDQYNKKKVDGFMIWGLIVFLRLYSKLPHYDGRRLKKVLDNYTVEELRDLALDFMPKYKEHGRQWAKAITKTLVNCYNNQLKKLERLDPDPIGSFDEVLRGMAHFKYFGSMWEMRKSFKTRGGKAYTGYKPPKPKKKDLGSQIEFPLGPAE